MLLIKTLFIFILTVINLCAYSLNQTDKTHEINTTVVSPTYGVPLIIELNPLIIANQGLGLNSEVLFATQISVGCNVEYYVQNPYNSNKVLATRNMINIAPFIRYYIFSQQLSDFFVGLKSNFVYSQAQINDPTANASYNNFFMAPSLHFGYRFISTNYITLSAYAGIGIKSSSNQFPRARIPTTRTNNQDWTNALNMLDNNVSSKQSDYGLAFGYMF